MYNILVMVPLLLDYQKAQASCSTLLFNWTLHTSKCFTRWRHCKKTVHTCGIIWSSFHRI